MKNNTRIIVDDYLRRNCARCGAFGTGRPDHDRPDHDRPDHDRPELLTVEWSNGAKDQGVSKTEFFEPLFSCGCKERERMKQ